MQDKKKKMKSILSKIKTETVNRNWLRGWIQQNIIIVKELKGTNFKWIKPY